MKYYLLPNTGDTPGDEYKIVKVQPEDVDSFLIRHKEEVLCEGNSITEVLLQFSSHLDSITSPVKE